MRDANGSTQVAAHSIYSSNESSESRTGYASNIISLWRVFGISKATGGVGEGATGWGGGVPPEVVTSTVGSDGTRLAGQSIRTIDVGPLSSFLL